jgi:flagellar biosynthesis/type III secretory pathway ATPase
MSRFEAAAYAHMLDRALARHFRDQRNRVPVRLPAVDSYTRLAAILREWESSETGAVLLRDSGTAVRVASVAMLQQHEAWPPRGTVAAPDGTWVLEQDGRVTRLY